MSTPNDGGPAFPCETYGIKNGKETTIPTNGMSLRDWFAGQAICGIIHSGYPLDSSGFPPAKYAYKLADAMLDERAQGRCEVTPTDYMNGLEARLKVCEAILSRLRELADKWAVDARDESDRADAAEARVKELEQILARQQGVAK